MEGFLVDLSDVKEQSFEPLKPGTHPVTIDTAELKSTKTNDGRYVKVSFKVTDGDGKGKKVFHNFNIVNPNAQAVEIGKSQLKTMMVAAKMNADALRSVAELVGKKLVIKTGYQKDQDGNNQPVVKAFESSKEAPSSGGGIL